MLVLLLALGLCTSVLVAWAGALVDRTMWPDTILTRGPSGTRTEVRGWLVEAGRDRTLTWRTFDALDLWDEPPDLDAPTELPAWSVGHGLADQPGPFAPARERSRDQAWEVSAGWPMRCVRAVRTAGPTEFALPGEFVRGGAVAMPRPWPFKFKMLPREQQPGVWPWSPQGRTVVVPLRPMPLGLLANTIVFALAWAVALAPLTLPGVWRRHRRRTRARCPRCAQSMGGLPDGAPCPECGWPPGARTPLVRVACGRGPMLGAALALVVLAVGASTLLVQQWMAVDRLPPLHYAAAVGDVQGIDRLLAAGVDANGPLAGWENISMFVEGTTPLGWAAARGQADAAERLLAAGARANEPPHERTAVSLAIEYQQDEIARACVAQLASGETVGLLAEVLPFASDGMRRTLVEGASWSDGMLIWAANYALQAQELGLVEALMDAGLAQLQATRINLLATTVIEDARAWQAPYRHDLGLTRYVLGLGLDDTGTDHIRFFRAAVRLGCVPALDALLEAYPHHAGLLHALRSETIAKAASAGGDAMLSRLVGEGVDLNRAPRAHYNALWDATIENEPDAVAALLRHGLDPTLEHEGLTLREWLESIRGDEFLDESWDAYHPFRRDAVATARIIDLLEAAEAEWHARERESPEPGDL